MFEPSDEEIEHAAKALNERSSTLDFDLSVGEGRGLKTPKDTHILLPENNTFDASNPSVKLKPQTELSPGGMCSCLSVAYYQPYFNVDTLDIQARLLRAILPFRKDPTFGEIIEQDSVDAYGPLWIAATFVFITACCSNAAAWIDFTLGHTSAYAYDLGRVATALTMTLVFVLGFPGTLWVIGKSVGVQLPLGTLLCLYGYSVLVYLPATVLCVLPTDALDWVILLLAMSWSLYFLLTNVWTIMVPTTTKEKLFPVIAFIGLYEYIESGISLHDQHSFCLLVHGIMIP